MVKILANDGIHPDGKLLLEEAGYQVDTTKVSKEDLPSVLPNYDVVIVRSATKIRKALIDLCPNLKIIARAGVGLDNIDVAYAKSKGIRVMNTPAASSQSVAELTFGHLFTLARSLHTSNREMPSKGDTHFKKLKKSFSKGFELKGKTLGVIGCGRIGQAVIRMALGLGMNILPVDLIYDELKIDLKIFSIEDMALSLTVRTVEWETMLAKSDFITLHIPFTGKPVLSTNEFNQMKDGVVLINASRGGTVDEAALLEALESGKVLAAGLDVYENEPTPKQALLQHPNVSLTPHIGASTLEAQSNIGLELADKIIAFYGD